MRNASSEPSRNLAWSGSSCSEKDPCGRPSGNSWTITTALHYAHLAMSLINRGALGCVLLMRGLAGVHELAQAAALRFRFPARDDSEPKGRRAVDARLQSPLVRWPDGA